MVHNLAKDELYMTFLSIHTANNFVPICMCVSVSR